MSLLRGTEVCGGGVDTHLGVTTVGPLPEDTTSAALTSRPLEEVPQNPTSLTPQASISGPTYTFLASWLSHSELRRHSGGQSLIQM